VNSLVNAKRLEWEAQVQGSQATVVASVSFRAKEEHNSGSSFIIVVYAA
jgi:hypothetical protein